MTDRCESLDAYVDGELGAQELAEFEVHLATCDECAAELPRLLALMAAFDGAVEASRPRLTLVTDEPAVEVERDRPAAAPPPVERPPVEKREAAHRPNTSRRAWMAAAGAVALAAGWLLYVRSGGQPTRPDELSLETAMGPTRPFAVRLSYRGTDGYRPLGVQRGSDPVGASDRRLELELKLEQAKNWHGAAVVALLAGDRTHATSAFANAPATPQVESDRAAFELLDGSPEALERALASVDRALAAAPGHGAALWNRALIQAAMHAPLAAALDFDRVAALAEPGWAAEARLRAAALRSEVTARRTRWQRATDAGRKLIEDGTPVPDDLVGITGYMTIRFYDAVRSAASRSAVEALLPLARKLDAAYRSDRLAAYVQQIAASDFRVRKPLAERYRELVLNRMPAAAVDAFLAQLERAGAHDIWQGALVRTGKVAAHLEDYRRLTAASKDPWLLAIAEQETAKAERERGDLAAAEARLRDAIAPARAARLAYRATLLELDLAELYERNLVQAHQAAQSAYREAMSAGEGVVEMNALLTIAGIDQERYASGLARVYLTEVLERTDTSGRVGPSPLLGDYNCTTRQYAYEALANVSLLQRDLARARTEVSSAPACSAPTALGTLVRAELYRSGHRDDDLKIARDNLAALRPTATPEQQALLSYIEGVLLINVDRAAGQRALRDAITRADHHPDALASDALNYYIKARAYSFSQLALDAGRASEFADVIAILAENLEVARPERCAVAVAVQDERSVVAFSDAHGQTDGRYTARETSAEVDVATLVPAAVVERLRACERVAVLARAPVLGAGRLLPPDVAWSYRLKGSASPARDPSGHPLVIANPEAPPELKLPPLGPYPDDLEPGAVVLRGADATPRRVLQEMRTASVIEFHTHGFIGNDVSEASYLVLSPELDRQYALTSSDVARVKLEAAPLVILGACHAATSSRSQEGGVGLAEAFLRSGARAVVASPEAVQDRGAFAFFAGIRERVMRGADPAIALRDERLRRLAVSNDDAWVSGVVVFQ